MSDLAPTPFDDLDPWAVLRPQDIAERLCVDPRSVRRAISSGALPASRACGLRVLAADAAGWWRAGVVAKAPKPSPAVEAGKPGGGGAEPTRRLPSRRVRRGATDGRLPLPPRGSGA